MSIRHAFVVLGLVLSPIAAHAMTATLLPIEAGTWVRDGTPDRDVPFAAMFTYDGKTISGAHSGGCTSKVLSHVGADYALSTTCTELGDGTAAQVTTEIQHVVVASRTAVRFAHATDSAGYHLRART